MAISLGRLLAEKRESRYLSLTEAEMATHIKADYLRALEEERFEALPGPTYAEIYLREYARYLDLEPEALLKMYADRMRWARFRRRIAERWAQMRHKGQVLSIALGGLVLLLVVALGTTLALLAFQPSAPVQPTALPFPTTTPLPKRLVVVYPQDGAIVSGPQVTVVGQVPEGASLSINGQKVALQEGGYFAHDVALDIGDTYLQLKAWDETGWEEEVERLVIRPALTPLPTVRPAERQPPSDHQVILNQIDVAHYPDIVAYFSVFDANGEPWRNLTAENLALSEDGRPITDFGLSVVPVGEPMAIALVVDVSGSMEGEPLSQAVAALRTFISTLGVSDTAALIAFGSQVTLLQDFTTDKAAISETLGTLRAGGNTALNDAVLFAVNLVAPRPFGRRAVVILTDGKDTASVGALDDAIGRAGILNIPVFAVGLQSPDFDAAPLERLAQETGALYLLAPEAQALRDLYAQLGRQFQGQYEVLYRTAGDGEERRLTLTTNINGISRQSSKSYRVP